MGALWRAAWTGRLVRSRVGDRSRPVLRRPIIRGDHHAGYGVAAISPALESMSDADLVAEAGGLFDVLAGTGDDPRAGQLHALLTEAIRQAAKLRP